MAWRGAYLAGEYGLVAHVENLVCESNVPGVRKHALPAKMIEKQVATTQVNGDTHATSITRRAGSQSHSAAKFVRSSGEVSILTRVASESEGGRVWMLDHCVAKQGGPAEISLRQLRGQMMQRPVSCGKGILAGRAVRQDEVGGRVQQAEAPDVDIVRAVALIAKAMAVMLVAKFLWSDGIRQPRLPCEPKGRVPMQKEIGKASRGKASCARVIKHRRSGATQDSISWHSVAKPLVRALQCC